MKHVIIILSAIFLTLPAYLIGFIATAVWAGLYGGFVTFNKWSDATVRKIDP